MKESLKNLAFLFVPLTLYALLSVYLFDWIVDDAGISFTYAKNLSNGNGLTSYPGLTRVEGYSNFLWVLILAFFHTIQCFDPIITPKVLAFVLTCVIGFMINRWSKKVRGTYWPGFFINLFLFTHSSYVIWSVSGLENSIYLFTILLYFYLCYKNLDGFSKKYLVGLSIALFLIVITRLEGGLFGLAFPMVLLFQKERGKLKKLVWYVGASGILIGLYLFWKYLYFGDIFPNTYYAKSGNYLAYIAYQNNPLLLIKNKLLHLAGATGTSWFYWLHLFLVPWLIFHLFRRSSSIDKKLIGIFYFLSGFSFVMLADDWMREYRFATSFIAFSYIGWIYFMFDLFYRTKGKLVAPIIMTVLLFAFHVSYFWPRTIEFASQPTNSLLMLKDRYVDYYEQDAKRRGLKGPSILIPDVGAMMYYSSFRVYDAAGLCDKVIAWSYYNQDRTYLYDYVFVELQPTYIHLHTHYTYHFQLHNDPRFRKDYVVIEESLDEEIEKYYGIKMLSGRYIRKDAVSSSFMIQGGMVNPPHPLYKIKS